MANGADEPSEPDTEDLFIGDRAEAYERWASKYHLLVAAISTMPREALEAFATHAAWHSDGWRFFSDFWRAKAEKLAEDYEEQNAVIPDLRRIEFDAGATAMRLLHDEAIKAAKIQAEALARGRVHGRKERTKSAAIIRRAVRDYARTLQKENPRLSLNRIAEIIEADQNGPTLCKILKSPLQATYIRKLIEKLEENR